LGQKKSGLIRQIQMTRGSIDMEFSTTGQEKDEILIQVIA
jgi:hypothetical protein